MKSCSLILLVLGIATNNVTNAFVVPKGSITRSLLRTKAALEPTQMDEPGGTAIDADKAPSVEEIIDPRARLYPGRYDGIDYSIAFPSLLKRPSNLDGSHAGDYGFDPLGFSEQYDLYYMQECEIRHARLAMLAVVGWPLSELIAPNWMLKENGCAPSVLNGFNPLSFLITVVAFGAFGFFEYTTSLRRTKGTKQGDIHSNDMELIWKYGVAGDYDWDPLNLYSTLGDDAAGRKGLRTLEITQGRYAMLGIAYFALWEAITHSPIVKNNIFFHPNLALPFLGVAYFAWSQIFQFSNIRGMYIQIEYTKDGKQLLRDLDRMTKGPRDDVATKIKGVTKGIELPQELEKTVSQFGTSIKDMLPKGDEKAASTTIGGGVAGLTLLTAIALSNPFGGDNNNRMTTPPIATKIVPAAATTPKKPAAAPKLSAPDFSAQKFLSVPEEGKSSKKVEEKAPKFAAPDILSAPKNNDSNNNAPPKLPKFTSPELPKFTAPELPKFAAPEILSAPSNDDSNNKNAKDNSNNELSVPKFNAPELPKFAAPELPNFNAPEFSVPKFSAPELKPPNRPAFSLPSIDEKDVADPVIVEDTKKMMNDNTNNPVMKATPPPLMKEERAAEVAQRQADSKAALDASRKAARERQEKASDEAASRKAENQAENRARQERASEESAKRQAENSRPSRTKEERAAEATQRQADSKAALDASRKATRERQERASDEAAKRQAENRAQQERVSEEFAKRKAENRAALEKTQEEQAARRATRDEELAKAWKAAETRPMDQLEQKKSLEEKRALERADTQAKFTKRSYFGDSSVMGDSVKGGKILPKEDVSDEVKEIFKAYSK
eukprot:CAMPEP_0198250600 /NCGR_PEP_ID=MMETSP1447-20131203/1720_1 /TAXON_ID=420782 /ORGANISM="Chaetoceros dichaeta, Strain CCMP1751" /LENGTH=838 /DNA_ID=CAMNT_0043935447 /DNA_START=75 /DNA_END=2588 /DNA_ORIENTATION=-